MNNPYQNFEEVKYQNNNNNNCLTNLFNCVFFTSNYIYNQNCSFCCSSMFINSTSHKEIILNSDIKKNDIYEEVNGIKYKNYRKAKCLNCHKDFESNWKEKKYFLNCICYKSINRFDKKY